MNHDVVNPRLSAAPRWDARSRPGAYLLLAQSCANVLSELLSASRAERVAFLIDTRSVHRRIFLQLTPDGFDVYAGTYRGEPSTPLERRFAVIRHRSSRRPFRQVRLVHPARVATQMDWLAGYITETFSRQWDDEGILWRCARIFREFLEIHPYLDGNGQLSRIMMHIMAHDSGMSVSANWTLHVRPYDSAMGYCLRRYRNHPELLVGYLKRWFGRWNAH